MQLVSLLTGKKNLYGNRPPRRRAHEGSVQKTVLPSVARANSWSRITPRRPPISPKTATIFSGGLRYSLAVFGRIHCHPSIHPSCRPSSPQCPGRVSRARWSASMTRRNCSAPKRSPSPLLWACPSPQGFDALDSNAPPPAVSLSVAHSFGIMTTMLALEIVVEIGDKQTLVVNNSSTDASIASVFNVAYHSLTTHILD